MRLQGNSLPQVQRCIKTASAASSHLTPLRVLQQERQLGGRLPYVEHSLRRKYRAAVIELLVKTHASLAFMVGVSQKKCTWLPYLAPRIRLSQLLTPGMLPVAHAFCWGRTAHSRRRHSCRTPAEHLRDPVPFVFLFGRNRASLTFSRTKSAQET